MPIGCCLQIKKKEDAKRPKKIKHPFVEIIKMDINIEKKNKSKIAKLSQKWLGFLILVGVLVAVLFIATVSARGFVVYNASDTSNIYFVVNGSTGLVGIGTSRSEEHTSELQSH